MRIQVNESRSDGSRVRLSRFLLVIDFVRGRRDVHALTPKLRTYKRKAPATPVALTSPSHQVLSTAVRRGIPPIVKP